MFRHLVNHPDLQKDLKLNPHEAIKIFFEIPKRGVKERFWYGFTAQLNYAAVKTGKYKKLWDDINDYSILGMIADETDCEKILKLVKDKNLKPLRLNIAVVDYFEEGGNWSLKNIATPLVWKQHKVDNFILPMIDQKARVPVECVILLMDVMRECKEKNGSFQIHCKAGKGRSALMIATFIALFEKEAYDPDPTISLKKAIEIVKGKREHIVIDNEKFEKGVEAIIVGRKILAHMEKIKLESKDAAYSKGNASEKQDNIVNKEVSRGNASEKKDDLLNNEASHSKQNASEMNEQKPDIDKLLISLNQVLASTLTKVEIAQLISFKQLAIYAAAIDNMLPQFFGVVTKRTEHIKNLFEQIYSAKDSGWLFNFMNLVMEFLKASPTKITDSSAEEDSEKRSRLIFDFYNEIQAYLETQLKCEEGVLKKILQKQPSQVAQSEAPAPRLRLTTA